MWHNDKITKTRTLYWKCTKTNEFGCSWFKDHHPVEGWKAERRDIRDYKTGSSESYLVLECPEFVSGR